MQRIISNWTIAPVVLACLWLTTPAGAAPGDDEKADAPAGAAEDGPGDDTADAAADDAAANDAAADDAAAKKAAAEAEERLGGAGESCRARSDCRRGLKCVELTCVDERQGESCQATRDCGDTLRCIDQVCTTPLLAAKRDRDKTDADADADAPDDAANAEPWSSFRITDGEAHPFVGLGLGVGTAMFVVGSQIVDPWPANLSVPVQGGVVLGIHELSLEVSPFILDLRSTDSTMFQMNAAYAVFIPLGEHFSYPLRAGLGFGAGSSTTEALMQARVDVLGFAYDYGHVRVDVRLPSVRLFTDFENHYLSLQGGATASYAF